MISIILKTIFFYIFIIICYRIMGKKELGELSISDLTISILIAELVAISIEENRNMFYTVVPIILLVFLEIIFSLLELKNGFFKRMIDGKPSLLINNRKLNIKEMVKQRYSITDLLAALRTKGISNINDVKYAVLENNGSLSIFNKNNDNYPLPLIIDGEISFDSLKDINKDIKWLSCKLNEYGLHKNDILYAFYKDKTVYFIKKK